MRLLLLVAVVAAISADGGFKRQSKHHVPSPRYHEPRPYRHRYPNPWSEDSLVGAADGTEARANGAFNIDAGEEDGVNIEVGSFGILVNDATGDSGIETGSSELDSAGISVTFDESDIAGDNPTIEGDSLANIDANGESGAGTEMDGFGVSSKNINEDSKIGTGNMVSDTTGISAPFDGSGIEGNNPTVKDDSLINVGDSLIIDGISMTGAGDGFLDIEGEDINSEEDPNDTTKFVPQGGRRSWKHRWFISFFYSSTKTKRYNWFQAASQCWRRGLVLVSIENRRKNRIINELLKLLGKIQPHLLPVIWTSGTKQHRTFRWVNGKQVGGPRSRFTNWASNGVVGKRQPDNAYGNEYCLAVWKDVFSRGPKWHDKTCQAIAHFICELPSKRPPF